MFTAATRASGNSSYAKNTNEFQDDIASLAIAQRWPLETGSNLTERAAHQAKKLRHIGRFNKNNLMLITSQSDLTDCLNIRRSNSSPVGGFIRTEGSNRLAGNRSDIKYLFGLSVQIMSLHHFFDNDLGGSLHGKSRSRLTIFWPSSSCRNAEIKYHC